MKRSMINWSLLAAVLMLLVFPACKKSRTLSKQVVVPPAPARATPVEQKSPVEQKAALLEQKAASGEEKAAPGEEKATATDEANKKAEEARRKAEEANLKNVPVDPKAPKPDPKVKPEDQAILLAGMGVKRVRFKGLDKPLDVAIGMNIMDLTGPLAIELGEAQAKTHGSFSYDGHRFNYTKGTLVMMTLALNKIPGGLQDSRVVIPQRVGIASVKSLIDSCGAIAKVGQVSTLRCHKGKTVVTHDAVNGVRITIGK